MSTTPPVPPSPGEQPASPAGAHQQPSPSYQPQPQQPQPPFGGAPSTPPPWAAGATGPRPSTANPMGLVSLLAGVLSLVWQCIFLFIQVGAVIDYQSGLLEMLTTLNVSVSGILSLVALVFGIIGLAQRDRPRVLAGIGLGIGISGVVGTVLALIYPLMFTVMGY